MTQGDKTGVEEVNISIERVHRPGHGDCVVGTERRQCVHRHVACERDRAGLPSAAAKAQRKAARTASDRRHVDRTRATEKRCGTRHGCRTKIHLRICCFNNACDVGTACERCVQTTCEGARVESVVTKSHRSCV